MAVRNFYIECNVDGRNSVVKGGPASKDGGMRGRIYQRDEGQISTAFSFDCFVNVDGELMTVIFNSDGQKITEFKTLR